MKKSKGIYFFCWGIFLIFSVGCVKRDFIIQSKPEKAICEVNGRFLGETPVKITYSENGIFKIRLSKPNFETYNGQFSLTKKWHHYFVLDFIGEAIPYRWTDTQNIEFELISQTKMTPDFFKNKIENRQKK